MLPDGELSFVPRAAVLERLAAGWSLVDGHAYQADDYAFLMRRAAEGGAVREDQIARAERWFAPRALRSNLSAAACWRNAGKTASGRAIGNRQSAVEGVS